MLLIVYAATAIITVIHTIVGTGSHVPCLLQTSFLGGALCPVQLFSGKLFALHH